MNTKTIQITYWIIAALLMMSAVIANQFSDEFSWDKFDFLVLGIMLLGAGFAVELVLRFAKKPQYRLGLFIIIAAAFLLIWAELAVGIFS
ncbi:hypothetical protein [Kangiella koreensis]|uniref:Uncharacterized protein n=1 Tax=Kangiella koreensis (strain DSM 16069 / JCM 12317 / KCTC 12182 / SW-125) TaxID=523791 RepID=C7R5U6_KANKD|nr:hypothetical protein [Kangiella koreensis]ACV27270.1 conserved hypothetical protein [Kangiella koreensis DSM 16069]